LAGDQRESNGGFIGSLSASSGISHLGISRIRTLSNSGMELIASGSGVRYKTSRIIESSKTSRRERLKSVPLIQMGVGDASSPKIDSLQNICIF